MYCELEFISLRTLKNMFMKQMKFWMVALTILMGVSFTSCMNGEKNTTTSGYLVAKVSNTFPAYEFKTLDGYTMSAATQQPNIIGTEASYGDLVYIAYTYDYEVDVDATNKKIKISLYGIEKIDGNQVTLAPSKDEPGYEGNRGVQAITIEGTNSTSKVSPFMYADNDNSKLVIPIIYYAKEKLSDHKFSIVYYEDELGQDQLVLHLRHFSSETEKEETKTGFSYKAFDIASALYEYNNKNGRYPTEIKIYADINTSGTSVPENPKSTIIPYERK